MVKAREKNIIKEISGIIRENKHEGYLSLIKELSQNYDINDIAAAALYIAYGETKETPVGRAERERRHCTSLYDDRQKGQDNSLRYREDPLLRKRRFPLHKIGKINVFEKFTFVEVSQEFSDKVIRSLNDVMMKGKRVKVRKATPKPA